MKVFARIREALAFFRAFAKPISVLVAAYGLPLIVAEGIYARLAPDPESLLHGLFIPMLAWLLYRPFYQGGLIALFSSMEGGRTFPPALWLPTSSRFWGRLLAIDLITYLAMVLASGPMVFISSALSVGGAQAGGNPSLLASGLLVAALLICVMVAARLSLAGFFVVLEDRGIADSLKLSLFLTRPRNGEIMAGTVILYMGLFIVNFFLSVLVKLSGGNPILDGVASLALAVLATVPLIFFFRYYGILRIVQEPAEEPGSPERDEPGE